MRALRWGLALTIGAVAPAAAADCWVVTDLAGYSAFSSERYEFVKDGIDGDVTVCFTDDGGTVSGIDDPIRKVGTSTLAAYGNDEAGRETYTVYQLDRDLGKLHVMETRTGATSAEPPASNFILAYIGDAAPTQ